MKKEKGFSYYDIYKNNEIYTFTDHEQIVIKKYQNYKFETGSSFIAISNDILFNKSLTEQDISLYIYLYTEASYNHSNGVTTLNNTSTSMIIEQLGLNKKRANKPINESINRLSELGYIKILNEKKISRISIFDIEFSKMNKNQTFTKAYHKQINIIKNKSKGYNILKLIYMYVIFKSQIYDYVNAEKVFKNYTNALLNKVDMSKSTYQRRMKSLCDMEVIAYFQVSRGGKLGYQKNIYSDIVDRKNLTNFVAKTRHEGEFHSIIE